MAAEAARSLVAAAVGPRTNGFRRFWLATAVSVLGTWAAAVALSLRMFDVTHSAGWVAALLFAEFVPTVAIGLLFSDRLNRVPIRRALVASDVANALVFTVLALVHEPAAVVALAAVAGIATGVFRPLSIAAVPVLARDEDLEAANGALGSADYAMTFSGYALGGIAVAAVGAEVALLANAATFLASAALIAGCVALGTRPAPRQPGFAPRPGQQMRRSIAAIARSPALRQIAVVWSVVFVLIGAANATEVPLLRGIYKAGPGVVGLLLGLTSLGLVAGSLVAGRRRLGPAAFTLSIAGMGGSWLLAGVAPAVGLAAIGLTSLGVFNGVALVLNRSSVARATAPEERPGLIAFLISIGVSAQATGTVLGGAVASIGSPRWVYVGAGLVGVFVAAPLAALLRTPQEGRTAGS
ncbi:MAG: MFS transporter [Gaiellales bacterium]